jgi:hypothetical protein
VYEVYQLDIANQAHADETANGGIDLSASLTPPTTESPSRSEAEVPTPSRLDSIGTSQHGCPISGWIVKGGKAFPVHCGRWDCAYCCRQKGKKAWVKIKNSEARDFHRLLTLPFRIGIGRSWEQAIADSGSTLNRFFTSLRRKFRGIKYVWVREVGSVSNMVHFHILVDRYLPKPLLSRMWDQAGGGYIVDIGMIQTSASYVCKYLAKLAFLPREVLTALTGKRRYSSSRGMLYTIPRSSLWSGATFQTVSPWLSRQSRLLCVVDGIFYFEEAVCPSLSG